MIAPIMEAYARGIVKVPVLFQVQAQEPDLGPSELDGNMTAAAFEQRLRSAFVRFPAVDISKLMQLYSAELLESPQLAYETIVSDMRMVCGNIELGRAWAAGATGEDAPAFLSLVVARPSHPLFIFDDAYGMQYSGHLLDLLALLGLVGGTHACCDAESWQACNPRPRCNRQGPLSPPSHLPLRGVDFAPFEERLQDVEETDTMREIFFRMASRGADGLRSLGWQPVNRTGPAYGVLIGNNGTKPQESLRGTQCAFWQGNGFGPEFWWAD